MDFIRLPGYMEIDEVESNFKVFFKEFDSDCSPNINYYLDQLFELCLRVYDGDHQKSLSEETRNNIVQFMINVFDENNYKYVTTITSVIMLVLSPELYEELLKRKHLFKDEKSIKMIDFLIKDAEEVFKEYKWEDI